MSFTGHQTWGEFYAEERLLPMAAMAERLYPLLVGSSLGSSLQSQGLQPAALKTTSFAPPSPASTSTGTGPTVQLAQGTPTVTQPPAGDEADDTPAPRKRPVLDLIESLGNSVTSPTKTTAATGTSTSRPTPIKDAVKQASDQVKKTVDDVNDGVKKAVSDAQKAVNDTAKKVNDAAKKATTNGAAS